VSDGEDSYGPVTARFYDAAYATLPGLGRDVEFYRALARASGGPVLELGCGTGRVLLALAGEGIACSGLDASAEMLAVARTRAGAAAPRLVQARMQDFDLGAARFALIYSAFRAFQHLYSVEDQLACLARVRAHLAPGGSFAFDVFHPRLDRVWEPESPEEEDLRFEQDGEQVVRFVRATRDPVAQILHLSMRYERRRAGLAVGSELARFRMRWFTRFELAHLLARAGFESEIWGDFDRSPVVRESPALVVLARPVSA
jgi:SAM-dependent methyltransferase